MPLLVTEAAKLAIEDRQRGVIEEIITEDGLYALLPFVHANDKVYSYVREATIAGGGWFSAYEDLEESASTFTPVSTELKVLAGQVDMDKFTTTVRSGLNDQIAIQLAAKTKGVSRDFRNTLINGSVSVNSKQFDGLKVLTPGAQTLYAGTNGGPVTYDLLDQLKDTVKLGADVLMMQRATWRAIKAMNRQAGGNTADMMMIENFGKPVPAYDGTPVIFNEFIPINETRGSNNDTTSIYALRLNEVDGLHGLYGGPSAGMRVEKIGTLEGRDAERWRVTWYCGLALKATHAVARLAGVTNV